MGAGFIFMISICSGCTAVANLAEVTLGSLSALQTLNSRSLALEEIVRNLSAQMTALQLRMSRDEHSLKSDIDIIQVLFRMQSNSGTLRSSFVCVSCYCAIAII